MVGIKKRIVSFGFLALVFLASSNLISSPSQAAMTSICTTGLSGSFDPTYFPNGCVQGACGPCLPPTGLSVCNVINAAGDQQCICGYHSCGVFPPPTPAPPLGCSSCGSGQYFCAITNVTCVSPGVLSGATHSSTCSIDDETTQTDDTCGIIAFFPTTEMCSLCAGTPTPTPAPAPAPVCAPQPSCALVAPFLSASGSCPTCATKCYASPGTSGTDWDCTPNTTFDACGCAICGQPVISAQGVSDGCVASAATPAPIPSVSPAPSASATPNCLDTGGNGRLCNGDSDCCTSSNFSCQIVGNQPVQLSLNNTSCTPGATDCSYGVNWATDISGGGVDVLTQGNPVPPPYYSVYTGPTKMCVDGSHSPGWGFAPNTPQLPYAAPAPPVLVYPQLLTWTTSSSLIGYGFVCNLQDNDLHRVKLLGKNVGCSCDVSGAPAVTYEPWVISKTQFQNLTYNVHMGAPSLNTLWADVVSALHEHPAVQKALENSVTKTSEGLEKIFGREQASGSMRCTPPTCLEYYPGIGYCYPAGPGGCGWGIISTGGANPVGPPPTIATCSAQGCSSSQFACTTFTEACSGSTGDYTISSTGSCSSTDLTGAAGSGRVCGPRGAFNIPGLAEVCAPCAAVSPTPISTPLPLPTPSGSVNPLVPTPLYVDSPNHTWKGNGYEPYLTLPGGGYGTLSMLNQVTGVTATQDLTAMPANEVVACIRACPATAYHDPIDPTTCDCPAGQSFDPVTWSCLACPPGSILLNGHCQCPQGWNLNGGTSCIPNLPTGAGASEYIYQPYPVCGQGVGTLATPQNSRLPTTYGLQITQSSGTSTPLTTDFAQINSNTYEWSDLATSNATSYPLYQYANLPHCACMGSGPLVGTDQGGTTALTSGTPIPVLSKTGGDTLDFITSFSSSGLPNPNKKYGMVAIALDGKSDGRSGALFQAGTSSCGCPNVNEIPILNIVPGVQTPGVTCQPVFIDSRNRILATFNPATDDVPGKSQVYTRTQVTGVSGMISGAYTEPVLSQNVTTPSGVVPLGNVVPTISIPTSQSAPSQLAVYQRHIWKCQIGYTLNLATLTCDWGSATNNHQCDSTSPISPTNATGGTLSFANVINKKLACCMNNYIQTPVGALPPPNATQSTADVKFDCIDNTKLATDFNTLWSSSDQTYDGSGANQGTGDQINAMVLASAGGKPLTGFYTSDGARCNEFSEFDATGIHPGTVNPAAAGEAAQQTLTGNGGINQFTATTTTPTVYLPATGSTGFQQLVAGFSAAGKSMVAPHPETGAARDLANARRCPILVRAAMVATCPAVTTAQNAVRYTENSQPANAIRCPQADHIQVHIRAEQVFTIAGTAPMQTIDTIVDNKDVNAISLDAIMRKKNGSQCLPGMIQGTSGCHY